MGPEFIASRYLIPVQLGTSAVKTKEDARKTNLLCASSFITRLLCRPLVNSRPKLLLPSIDAIARSLVDGA